jgi:hypothetical protein
VDRQLTDFDKRLDTALLEYGSGLTDIGRVGVILASGVLAQSRSIVACASAAHYTSYAGAAPVEIANSDHTCHRLSRSGEPPVQLRDPLHRITASRPQPRRRRHLLPTEARSLGQPSWVV